MRRKELQKKKFCSPFEPPLSDGFYISGRLFCGLLPVSRFEHRIPRVIVLTWARRPIWGRLGGGYQPVASPLLLLVKDRALF